MRGYYIDGMFHVLNMFGSLLSHAYRFNPVAKQWEDLVCFELMRYSLVSVVADSEHIYSICEDKVMEFD